MARVTEEQIKKNREIMKKSREQAERDPSSSIGAQRGIKSLSERLGISALKESFAKAGLAKKKKEE